MNAKYAHVYQNNWWQLDAGWIGFGARPFNDREVGLIWEIGYHEHRTVYLPGNRYRYEQVSASERKLKAVASKGMDGEPWQQSCYIHEADTVEELRAWIAKKARNMARGYKAAAPYHDGLKASAAAERERLARLSAYDGDLYVGHYWPAAKTEGR